MSKNLETIALINPNSNVKTTAMMLAIASPLSLGMPISGFTAQRAPQIITDAVTLDASVAEVVEIARSLQGFSAIIVAAFGDPGVDILRQTEVTPVIGIGGAAARRAARDGLPFAVATTTPQLAARIDQLMRSHNGKAAYIGSFITQGDAVMLMSQMQDLDDALLQQIDRAARAGAKQIIIGGGPLGEAAARLNGRTALPLIHPIKEAVRECVALLMAKRGAQ
ncbi:MAG: Asp/Glu/hydantoin racemase [Pseudorhodobacter sp.]|jgi:allantoin racemase